ncbi:hypothetical protein ACFO5K_04225 [Nocardia halotolerans]|uniref:Uncharacterized protein n=1 Tax=Nocardia halotolerans TaxID=1755878 RepID=A0ABV8VDX7_9NOCA
MRSITWHLGDGTPVTPGRLYKTRNGMWAEPSPMHCPEGHRLGPNRVIVGTTACQTVGGHHRTHTCRRCDTIIYWPPVVDGCDHRAFDGRAR